MMAKARTDQAVRAFLFAQNLGQNSGSKFGVRALLREIVFAFFGRWRTQWRQGHKQAMMHEVRGKLARRTLLGKVL
jgi:hypothetical protein